MITTSQTEDIKAPSTVATDDATAIRDTPSPTDSMVRNWLS